MRASSPDTTIRHRCAWWCAQSARAGRARATDVDHWWLCGPLGMTEAAVTARSFPRWAAGPAVAVPGVVGQRMIRPGESGSTRFWLVFDRTAPDRDREITAIFVR